MKKIIFIGKSGSGKTTLSQRINGKALEYEKTQMLINSDNIIDTPGEYLENRMLYNALIVSSYESDVIGIVQANDDSESMFPPRFSSAFTKEMIGIVTKCDLEGSTEKVIDSLKEAGATKIFKLSSYENEGIKELIEYLEE